MAEIYDAHEQGEIVKKWLRENGSAIVMGLVIAFGGLFGFKQWQLWQVNNKQAAFAEFDVMSQLLSAGQLDAAVGNFQNLQDSHSKTPYASLAALQMARARLEASQVDLAIGHYRQVMEQGRPPAIRIVARERLARLLLDQGQPDEALQVIQGQGEIAGFEAIYAEVRGDILVALGQQAEAISAYQQALDSLEAGAGDRAMLALKLESLGVIMPDESATS